jgi:predicted AAA+ superfamily ATPase
MNRSLRAPIFADLKKKVVFISGPRQAGKTYLSKNLLSEFEYLNYDDPEHRLRILERSWDRSKPLIILDELHKMADWKTFLKGLFDVEGIPPSIVVTGSARMETFRKIGDSMAGRFFAYRLHPFDVKELKGQMEPADALERILRVGGFPEPFLENDEVHYARWRKTHLDVILRQDLIDLVAVADVKGMETLVELLRSRVGSPLSYANLVNDLQKDPKTVKAWLTILENLHVIFPVRPWHRNIARAILKEPKYYFLDTGQVKGDHGKRLENAVACSLRKELDYLEDTRGLSCDLHYLRTKDGKEVDFAVSIGDELRLGVEVKWNDDAPHKGFDAFSEALKGTRRFQLLGQIKHEKTFPDGLEVRLASNFLADIDLLA